MNTLYGNMFMALRESNFEVVINFCYDTDSVGACNTLFRTAFEASNAADYQFRGPKLGKYSSAIVEYNGRDVEVVNAYIRHLNPKLDCDVSYEALRNVLGLLKEAYGTKRIAIVNDNQEYNDWFAISASVSQFFPSSTIIVYNKHERNEQEPQET